MKRVVCCIILLACMAALPAQNALSKVWEQDYTSSSTYNFPQYLVYYRPIPACAPHRTGVFVVGKTGNGEIFIRDYDITNGSLTASQLYQNDTYSGSNFYLGIAQNINVRASDSAYSNLVFTVVSSKTNANGDYLMFTQLHDPGNLNILSSVVDTVTLLNPSDTLIRNNVCLPDGIIGHVQVGVFKNFAFITPSLQDHSLIADPANSSFYNPGPQFHISWCSNPIYTAVSTGLCTYYISDSISTGYANGWFGNYKNPFNPSQRKIVVKAKARSAFSYMPNSILELSADSCSLFEADFIDRMELTDPTTRFAMVVRKQYNNNPLCNYYLYILNAIPNSIGAPDVSLDTIIPITSLTNQGINKSRTVMLKVYHNKIYTVFSGSFGDTYTFCHNWNGALLWQQTHLFDNCSVGVDYDSSGIYLGGKSGFGSSNPGYYQVIHYNAANGYKSLDYIDPTKSGMISDLKLDETGQYIFVTGYGNDGAQQVVKTVKYQIIPFNALEDTYTSKPLLSPIPANDELTIRGWAKGRYRIIDMEGRLVLHGNTQDDVSIIQLQTLSNGVYSVELERDGQHSQHKIIVHR